jgi:deoxyribodipyrimidine photo-lyase
MQLVWFKRDLRVQDNEALATAALSGPVLPVYIVEPELWRQADVSARQWAFLREALLELRAELTGIGQPLIVRTGDACSVLRDMISAHSVTSIWSHQETGNAWTYQRDCRVRRMLQTLGLPWHEVRQHGVLRGPLDRDNWSRHWERLMRATPYAIPTLEPVPGIDIGDLPEDPIVLLPGDCPGRQPGGRRSAEQALGSFLHVRGANYHLDMSSPRSADSSCSRLSAHLSVGTLSVREAVQATRRRLAVLRRSPQGGGGHWSRALAAFEGRLHWHCHFIQKFESEPRIEFENLQRAMHGLRPTTADKAKLDAWKSGMTGWPFVDACMRYLAHNGWINFRMRAMLMSVASYQLWLDWREPGLHLARQFVDYEPGIHWPQVQMQSGTTGINALRIYNPIKQSLDQDPGGNFIRTWVPELTRVPDEWLHVAWTMPRDVQQKSGCIIDSDYPAPLVDHKQAARLARQRIQVAHSRAGARHESRTIYQRHGSRRRIPEIRQPLAQFDMFDDDP